MLILPKLSVLVDAITARPAGKREVAHQHSDCFGDTNGGDGEVGTTQTECGQTNKKGCQHRHARSSQKSKVWISARIDQQSRRISSKSIKHGESKGHLSGKAADDVPG